MAQPPGYSDLLGLLPKEQVKSAMRLGLCLNPDLDRDSWSRLVASVVKAAGRTSCNRDTLTAWLGDLLAYGSDRYRGQITEYARAAGLAPGTLREAKLVCSRIPVLGRHNTLSWAHHCEIGKAFKDPVAIEHWLDVAEKGGHSKMELRRMIRIHLAEEASGGREPSHDQTAIKAFALLRDLRAMGRRLGNDAGSWKEWPPSIRKLALTETAPIARFLAELKVVAHEIPIAASPSTTSPVQSQATSFSGLPQVSAVGGRRTLRPPRGGLRSGNPRQPGAHAPQAGHPRMAGAAATASNSEIL
jgi:hypothetical protein